MEWPWTWDWLTPGECADYWNNLMRTQTDTLINKTDANSVVGFGITWGGYSLQDLTEMIFIDPLRLGSATGEASGSNQGWIHAGLATVTDASRAAAFLPIGKLMKVAAVERFPARFPPAPHIPHAPPVPHPPPPDAVLMTAQGSRTQAAVASVAKSLFEVGDPASDKGICAFVGLTKALRHSGRLLITIEKIAAIAGVKTCGCFFENMAGKAPWAMRQVGVWLNALKVPCREVGNVRTLEELMKHAATAGENGVYVFGVKWIVPGGGGKILGHLMYVGRTGSGELRIFDRTGHAVRNLAELEKLVPGYKGIQHAAWMPFGDLGQPIFIPNAKLIEVTAGGIKLAGITFGAGLTLGVPVRVFSFMTTKSSDGKR